MRPKSQWMVDGVSSQKIRLLFHLHIRGTTEAEGQRRKRKEIMRLLSGANCPSNVVAAEALSRRGKGKRDRKFSPIESRGKTATSTFAT